ncbi:MAG: T9SS type A sorting domain-containing protein [Saprospiraceae bacterium]|nr:T9SS type A sorting domain-containing protein [Bacteroidia bacterium]NNL93000.1 T9SS type A sorting domain-containing protein [Saprospiraceae bacterium]
MKTILSTFAVIVLTFSSLMSNKSTSVTLVCPSDVWLNCGAEIWDLSIYGQAVYYKNGYQYDAGPAQVVYDVTTCETGKIYRTWQIEDENWNIIECTQTISIGGGSFNYHNIYWPNNDLQLYGCGVNTHPDHLPYGYGRPTYDYLTCSMVGSSYKDQVFNFGPDCKKILRTWTVLDWCNYNTGGSNPGIWKYIQTIKVSGTSQPNLTCVDEVSIVANNCHGAYVSIPKVTVDEDGCYGGYYITNDSPYADNNGDDASGDYPIGTTTVNFKVEYSCGQEMYCSTKVIVDDKGPVPYCLSTLSVALMPVDTDLDGVVDDGMVEVWAKDLDYGSYHPCNNGPLKFSFSSNVDSTFHVFTCKEAGYNDMQLWVTDIHGNQRWCAVTLIVQNNAANIPDCEEESGAMAVSGIVTNQNSEPLENVYINLKSKGYTKTTTTIDTVLVPFVIDSFYNQGGLLIHIYDHRESYIYNEHSEYVIKGQQYNIMTDEAGRFGTNEPEANRIYNMTAFKIGDNSKVDQSDLDLLSSYLKEEVNFENPYSFIAADINEDGYIDFEDYNLLEEIFNEEEDEWPNERQWVFYNKADFETVIGNPLGLDLKQRITIDRSRFISGNLDFIGILKGDISNYETGEAINSEVVSRSITESSAKVYPNPFSDNIILENNQEEEVTITIYSVDGKQLFKQTTSDRQVQISSEEWNVGPYLYTIKTDVDITSGKIIKI